MTDAIEAVSALRVVERRAVGRTSFEVLEYQQLSGGDDPALCQMLFYAHQTGARLRQLRVILEESGAVLESGSLQFLKGRIEVRSAVGGVTGFLKKVASKMLSSETAFKPLYEGTGEIYLEPTFGHLLLVELTGESLYTDRGMFLAGSSDLEVGVGMQTSLTSNLLGNEGMFMTKVSGQGVCALQSPVPSGEVIRMTLNDETLQVDGNFALLRKGEIGCSVERSARGLLGTFTSGEGLLYTYRGTGEVWLAPTQGLYDQLRRRGLPEAARSHHQQDTTVETTSKVE